MVSKMNAKYHLERCLSEERDYSIGKAHCRLAGLYNDFDPQLRDVTELQFQLKWRRCHDAVPVLERIVKSHPSDAAWIVIHKMFVTAASQSTSAERDVLMEVPTDVLESVLSGLSKRFDFNDSLKTKLHLFAVQTSTDEKHTKLVVRAITHLCEKVNSDEGLVLGIGKYHIYIAVMVAPVVLKRNLAHVPLSRMITVLITTMHVALVCTAPDKPSLEHILKDLPPNCTAAAEHFAENSWDVVSALMDKCINTYELSPPIHLQSHSTDYEAMLKCIEKTSSVKAEAKKILLAYFVWRAFAAWRRTMAEDELLAWQPVDNWSTDVNKVIDDKGELIPEKGSPTKKTRTSRERRETVTLPNASTIANSTHKELCDVYELCSTAMSVLSGALDVSESEKTLRLTSFFPDIHRFISESLLFKCKFDEAIAHLSERADRSSEQPCDMHVLSMQLACANALSRNWADAFECLCRCMESMQSAEKESPREDVDEVIASTEHSDLVVIKQSDMLDLVFNILHHVFFKVYTSTAVDHENDQLLGSLLVLSQYRFSHKGFRAFNRIMRHIEAKGSMNYPGLVRHITNMTILEEISRVQEYCTEYVSVQVALPQVHRRIGQSTRHSVRGTKDGQRQSLDDQMKKWRNDPVDTVSVYLIDEKDNLAKLLESR